MKPKSVSGLTLYVKDLNQTIDFYEKLGFEFKKRQANHAVGYINWFWIDFVERDDQGRENFAAELSAAQKGQGIFIGLSVDDVEEHYNLTKDAGLKPESEPYASTSNREYILSDPDGYKLMFFSRK